MSLVALMKSVAAGCICGALVLLSSTAGQSQTGSPISVRLTAVSGYAGHAFVYAQVSQNGASVPAPTGLGHLSPYYAQWIPEPIGSPGCPWIWAVYVFNRVTNQQMNLPPPSAPRPNFGTTTSKCASPSETPVEEPPTADASARLDLDQTVTVTPAMVTAGSPSVISAKLSSTLTQDLSLYMNMAIEDWSVTGWSIDFGDGQQAALSSRAGTSLQLTHTYGLAGVYEVRAVATIAGHAQAALYDHYGAPFLIAQPFSVQVGNRATASVRSRAARRYVAPQANVTVAPGLNAATVAASIPGFRHIDVLRGQLTYLRIGMGLIRDGVLIVDGQKPAVGQSDLIGWRYDGRPSDAPAQSGTTPGQRHALSDLLQLQWNSPDAIDRTGAHDYVVPITLYVETRFPDGHLASYAIASSFSVTVDFAAQSG
jgi:hypothetical protein